MADQPPRPNRGAQGSGKGNSSGRRSAKGGGAGKNRGKPPGRGAGLPGDRQRRSTGGPARFGRPGSSGRKPRKPGEGVLSLKRLSKNEWAFVAPDCAVERQMDLEDARDMRQKQEEEIARDELLYLVADCHGFMAAHNELGELALEHNDVKLARGHFGFSYENGLKSLPPGFSGRLPADQGYNEPFFDAGRGLARCLVALGRIEEGEKLLKKLLQFDPDEPNTQSLLTQLDEYKAGTPPAPCGTSGGLLPIITSISPVDGDEEDEDDDDD